MNTILWITAGLLAAVFAFSSVVKLSLHGLEFLQHDVSPHARPVAHGFVARRVASRPARSNAAAGMSAYSLGMLRDVRTRLDGSPGSARVTTKRTLRKSASGQMPT